MNKGKFHGMTDEIVSAIAHINVSRYACKGMIHSGEPKPKIDERLMDLQDLLSEAHDKLQHICGQLADLAIREEPQPAAKQN